MMEQMTAKQRITPKKKRTTKKTATGSANGRPVVNVDVAPPKVDVAAPKVNVAAPQVNIPQPRIDLSNLENTLKNVLAHQAQVTESIMAIVKAQNEQISKIMDENSRILETIANRKPAARPDNFYVELDKDNGDTVGMRIRSRKTN